MAYVQTPSGLLKIIEFILLIIGFGLILDLVTDDVEICRALQSYYWYYDCNVRWQIIIFVVFAILAAVLTLVAFVAHLVMPAWMDQISAKIAYSELASCVVSAVLVLIGSSCLASVITKEVGQQVAGCVLGFIAFALLMVECAFLYRTASSVSA